MCSVSTPLNSLLQVLTHSRYIALQAASYGSIHFVPLERDLLDWDHQMHQGHKMRSIGAAEVAEKVVYWVHSIIGWGSIRLFSYQGVSANWPLPNEDRQEGCNQWVDVQFCLQVYNYLSQSFNAIPFYFILIFYKR